MDLNENITSSELKKLQEKYNKPRDPKQQKKYQEYEKKIQEIMKKPPNDRRMHYLEIGINEIKGSYGMDSEGYFYDPQEKVWCLYNVQPHERSNKIGFGVFLKKETEEEAFQSLYEMFEANVKRYERELEREKNNRMTKEEFLEWFRQDNRENRLAEKGPYQILWNRQPGDEQYAVGYYYEMRSEYIREHFGDDWIAYLIIGGECKMEISYRHETRAIYMMRYWIQLVIEGAFDE